MKRMNSITKLLAASALLFTGVLAWGVVVDSSVANVDGAPILSSDFDKLVQAVTEQQEAQAPGSMSRPGVQTAVEKEVLNKLVADKLLYLASEREKVKVRDSELDEAAKAAQTQLIGAVNPKTNKEYTEKEIKKQFKDILKKEGITENQFRDKIKEQLAVRKLLETVVASRVKPVEEEDVKTLYDEVKAFADGNKKKIDAMPEGRHKQEVGAIAARLKILTAPQVRIGHIYIAVPQGASAAVVKEKETLAKSIRKEIADGKIDFSEAVMKYSEDTLGKQQTGGDMVLAKGSPLIPKAIEDKAFALDVGKMSDPIKTDVGFHIIRVKEKKAGEELTYDKVAREFAQFIASQRVETVIDAYVEELRAGADIKITKKFDEPAAEEKAIAGAKEEKPAVAKEDKKPV